MKGILFMKSHFVMSPAADNSKFPHLVAACFFNILDILKVHRMLHNAITTIYIGHKKLLIFL